jgi:hypothetical protein
VALARACTAAFEILANHPQREARLAYRDPLSAETIALRERLRREDPHP